jgi:LPS export ABC transporter permease LptG
MATLVAVLATIGGLTRTGELTVMRACGVSLYRVATPLLLLALVWSGGLFLLDDRVLGHANRRAESLEDEIRGNPPRAANTLATASWQADVDRRIYYYAAFDPQTQTLHALSILEPTQDGARLLSHTLVRRATFANGTWHADGGWIQRFPAPNRSVREVLTPRTLTLMPPDQFSGAREHEAELMTFGDLREHITSLGQSGLNLVEPRVQLQERLAFPLVTVVMTILGVPFGVSTGRRGTLYGVGLAIILGAGYWLLNTFFLAVGSAGLLAPVMAAWATNALFLVVAVYATLTVRT